MTTYRIGDIRPNPFRDIENYPYIEKKIETLRASYRNTAVWQTIVARLVDEKPEIAFGHHRLEAALREFGPDGAIPLNIEDLDDATMLKMMANENMAEYEAAASVAQETVRQVVLAFADGRIELEAPPTSDHHVRSAPSFLPVDVGPGRYRYNALTVGAFLGWRQDKVLDALGALEEIERGTFTKADFHGLTGKQARAAVTGVRAAGRRVADQAEKRGVSASHANIDEAKRVAGRAAIQAAKVGAGHERVREAADSAALKLVPAEGPLPADTANRISADIEHFWSNGMTVKGGTLSRRDIVRLVAANRNAEGIRQYVGSIVRALREMNAINAELLELLETERALESVS